MGRNIAVHVRMGKTGMTVNCTRRFLLYTRSTNISEETIRKDVCFDFQSWFIFFCGRRRHAVLIRIVNSSDWVMGFRYLGVFQRTEKLLFPVCGFRLKFGLRFLVFGGFWESS